MPFIHQNELANYQRTCMVHLIPEVPHLARHLKKIISKKRGQQTKTIQMPITALFIVICMMKGLRFLF